MRSVSATGSAIKTAAHMTEGVVATAPCGINECGINGFDCLDEEICLDSSTADQFPDCTDTLPNLGYGECDRDNNTPDYGDNGGDCCICTLVDSMACTFDFNSIDANAGW